MLICMLFIERGIHVHVVLTTGKSWVIYQTITLVILPLTLVDFTNCSHFT